MSFSDIIGNYLIGMVLYQAAGGKGFEVDVHSVFDEDAPARGRDSRPDLLLENPLLRSGLALAGANAWLQGLRPPSDAEDGLLTAEDVTGLDLPATELVVLSACETGLGQVKVGEGILGLRRAFVLAGARTLVMSLWKVPDDATRELMEDFYQRLKAGEGRAEALRHAQLTLKAKYPDPLCWGAFICQGDPSPLDMAGPGATRLGVDARNEESTSGPPLIPTTAADSVAGASDSACPRCGAHLAADGAAGLCPRCRHSATVSEQRKEVELVYQSSLKHSRRRQAQKLAWVPVLILIFLVPILKEVRRFVVEGQHPYAQTAYERGNLLLDQGKTDEAIALFQKAIRLDPDFGDAHYELGSALGMRGQWQQAIFEFREAIRLQPNDQASHYNLGHALLTEQDLDAAISELRTAIQLKPDDAYAYTDLGIALDRQGKRDEAIAAYRQAICLEPSNAVIHANLGVALVRQGKHEEGIARLREALRLQPTAVEIHYNLANALDRMGRHSEAIDAFRTTIRLQPDHASAHAGLGSALSDEGKLAEAVAEYREAVRLRPGVSLFHRNLGVALGRLGKHEEEVVAFREAIRLQPENAYSHSGLAWSLLRYSRVGRRADDEALIHARKAVELAPKIQGFYNTLALAEYRVGHWAESMAASKRCMALGNGEVAYAWFLVAMVHWQRGDKDEARQWFEKATAWTKQNAPKHTGLLQIWAEAAELLGQPGPNAPGVGQLQSGKKSRPPRTPSYAITELSRALNKPRLS
jgi:superkiller protein 3